MIKLAKKKSKSDWVEIDGVKFLIDYPTNSQEMRLQELLMGEGNMEQKQLKYARLYLRYTIKGWEGIETTCLVIDNQLELELWESLVVDTLQTLTIFGKIYEELSFTENDKKKS